MKRAIFGGRRQGGAPLVTSDSELGFAVVLAAIALEGLGGGPQALWVAPRPVETRYSDPITGSQNPQEITRSNADRTLVTPMSHAVGENEYENEFARQAQSRLRPIVNAQAGVRKVPLPKA